VPTAERASGGGAAIRQVVPDAPANDAGLRAGDVIVRIGDARRRPPATSPRPFWNASPAIASP
jgi:C-terminal processing protease CtpA/Prc